MARVETLRRAGVALRREPLLAAGAGLAAALYAYCSIVRFDRLQANAYDLGIFDQVVWHYSRLETPASSVRGLENIWGDHFSPILALLAPLYWVWSDPRMLLLAQAALLAAGAVPVFLYARERLGRPAAHGWAAAYLAFWGIQAAIASDFHELAFAPVVLGCLVIAVDRRRWRVYWPLVVALLCVKEDMAVLVVFLGIYVAAHGHRRAGLGTAALGVTWYLVVVEGIIASTSPTGYQHWSYGAFGDSGAEALAHALTHPWQVLSVAVDETAKTTLLAWLFVPLLGLALLSRKLILIVPLLLERLLSSNPLHWETDFHYTLPAAALLFMAAADGLATLTRRLTPPARLRVGGAVAALLVAANAGFSLAKETDYVAMARAAGAPPAAVAEAAGRAVAAVPPEASVAVPSRLLPRVAQRDFAVGISRGTGVLDYAIVNVLDPGVPGAEPRAVVSQYLTQLLPATVPVAYEDGFVVLRARRLGAAARAPQLRQVVAPGLLPAYGDWLQALPACRGGPCDGARRLAAAIDGVRRELTPACDVLAARARDAVDQITAAARAGDREAVGRLGAADAGGVVGHFAALCTRPA